MCSSVLCPIRRRSLHSVLWISGSVGCFLFAGRLAVFLLDPPGESGAAGSFAAALRAGGDGDRLALKQGAPGSLGLGQHQRVHDL